MNFVALCGGYHTLRPFNVINITIFALRPLTGPSDYGIVSVMKRDIYQKLLTWKSDSRRKPLLLQGARQTGKTFILKAFGRNEYENVMYCNFEEDPGLDQFFQRDLKMEKLSICRFMPHHCCLNWSPRPSNCSDKQATFPIVDKIDLRQTSNVRSIPEPRPR